MALHEEGRDAQGRPLLPEAPTGPPNAAPSLFHAMLPPDIMLAGLDITVDALRESGWWIVARGAPAGDPLPAQGRRPRRPRSAFATREEPAHGAAVAVDRLEHPTRIAFEAGDFLPPVS